MRRTTRRRIRQIKETTIKAAAIVAAVAAIALYVYVAIHLPM